MSKKYIEGFVIDFDGDYSDFPSGFLRELLLVFDVEKVEVIKWQPEVKL